MTTAPPPTPPVAAQDPPAGLHVCAMGMGGSVPETLARIAPALRARLPGARITQLDLQAFHLRAPGTMPVPDGITGLRITPAEVGYVTPTRSMTLNLALSGGRLAHRRMVAVARARLGALRPDCLLCCHDRFYIETAVIEAARQLGIPTVFLQEGPFCVIGHGRANAASLRVKYALAPVARGLGLTPGMPDYGLAGHDRICAASDDYRRAWIARGVAAECIRVTGVPRYDPLVTARARRLAREPHPDGTRPTVLVLAQPFGAHGKVAPAAAERALRETGSALARLAQRRRVDIRVRRHPRADPADTAPLTAALDGAAVLEPPAPPFPERAIDVDLVVGFYSSAVLEALALGVPTVCWRLPADAFAEPGEAAKQERLADLGIPMAAARDTLASTMQARLDAPGQRPDPARASAELGPIDGRAAARTADAILETAGVADGTPSTRAADDAA